MSIETEREAFEAQFRHLDQYPEVTPEVRMWMLFAWEARAAQAAEAPKGWRLVPVEPATAMLSAFMRNFNVRNPLATCYAAMLDAAPTPPAAQAAEAPSVQHATAALVDALARSKGWMRGYAEAIIQDAIDRKQSAQATEAGEAREVTPTMLKAAQLQTEISRHPRHHTRREAAMSNETEREESRAALLEMRIDEMEREAPHPCLHVASFCIAWGGEGASASVVHGGWGAMLKAFAESIWVSGDTSHHREEWEEWLEQFADIDEWTADENGEPYCFTSDVGEISQVSIYRLDRAAQAAEAPIDMVLHCPACGIQHIDYREYTHGNYGRKLDWDNPPHRSHLCRGCGHIWRPADVPTNGVAAVKTNGKADSPIVGPAQAAEAREALTRLIEAGAELSNCAFNLAQRDHLEERERNVLDACRRKWDAAGTEYRVAFKGDSTVEQT